MSHDNNNRGVLFKNAEKEADSHPDYKGSLNVNGAEFWVSGWVNTSKAGDKYMGLKLKPKGAKQEETIAPFNDEVPF